MKISDFVFLGTTGDAWFNKLYHAEITVTTGFLWWKKTARRKIQQKNNSTDWFFVDTGEYVPHCIVAQLARAYLAQRNAVDFDALSKVEK